jgi:hypothetical protein
MIDTFAVKTIEGDALLKELSRSNRSGGPDPAGLMWDARDRRPARNQRAGEDRPRGARGGRTPGVDASYCEVNEKPLSARLT